MFHALSTPDYKALADYPTLTYGTASSAYGPMAVAWWPTKTNEAVCYLALHNDVHGMTTKLQHMFPRNPLQRDDKKAAAFAKTYSPVDAVPDVLMTGTPFFLDVWKTLYKTKPGQTLTYGALAAQAGRPLASRAVGQAMATNPVALLVPCHRVLGSNGALHGYAYGLTIKERLLADEQR